MLKKRRYRKKQWNANNGLRISFDSSEVDTSEHSEDDDSSHTSMTIVTLIIHGRTIIQDRIQQVIIKIMLKKMAVKSRAEI